MTNKSTILAAAGLLAFSVGAPATVRAGDTIVWDNRDVFKHTATARDGSFNVDLPPNAKARTVIRSAGAVPFYCIYHPGMTGVLEVAR